MEKVLAHRYDTESGGPATRVPRLQWLYVGGGIIRAGGPKEADWRQRLEEILRFVSELGETSEAMQRGATYDSIRKYSAEMRTCVDPRAALLWMMFLGDGGLSKDQQYVAWSFLRSLAQNERVQPTLRRVRERLQELAKRTATGHSAVGMFAHKVVGLVDREQGAGSL